MKKQLITASAIATVGLIGLAGSQAVNAESGTDTENPMSSIVTAISEKFHLDKSEVQSVFDEQHSAMKEERENEIKEEMSKLVSDGKLSQDQVDKILAKRAELQAQREANRSSDTKPSRDEMRQKMSEQRSQLETWAKEQNIDSTYLRYVFGHGGGHGSRDGDTRGNSQTTDTNS